MSRLRKHDPTARLLAACLATLVTACGNGSPTTSAPTSPTVPPSPVVTPANLPGSTGGPYYLSGSVAEHTPQGARNVADAAINLWIDAGQYGYSYWWANGQVHSDAGGTFRLGNLPAAAGWLQSWKEGFVQQCALPVIALNANADVEIALVARDNLSADPSSVPPSVIGRSVSGRVLEDTLSGPQPVASAFIDFEPVMDFPAATTYSDRDGRYLLCGLPAQQSITIGVGLGNRVTYVEVPPSQRSAVDIVLPH